MIAQAALGAAESQVVEDRAALADQAGQDHLEALEATTEIGVTAIAKTANELRLSFSFLLQPIESIE